MRNLFIKAVESLFRRDKKSVLVLGDIGVFGFKPLAEKYPDRVINIGICEQSTISILAGMAKEGLHPIFYSIAPFAVERCFEQIKIDIGYQNLPVTIVSVGGSYDYPALGCTHHCPGDVALLKTIPNMTIIVPSYAKDIRSFSPLHGVRPLYIRLSDVVCTETNEDKDYWLDKIVFAYGRMVDVAMKACRGTDIYVERLVTTDPVGFPPVEKLAVLEPWYEGTMAYDYHKAFPYAHKLFIGVPRKFLTNYGTIEEHDKAYGLDVDSVREKLNTFFNERHPIEGHSY